MGFEDLIEDAPATKTGNDFNAANHCPHCKTHIIIKYLVQGSIAGKRKQEAFCPTCNKRWYIVYDVDLRNSSAYIEFIPNKASVLWRP